MQANDEVARRLAQLTVRAGEQRAQIHNEIEMMRSRPTTAAKSVGKDALKAAKALGLTDPKVAIPLARTVFIPAALAIARLVLKTAVPADTSELRLSRQARSESSKEWSMTPNSTQRNQISSQLRIKTERSP